MKATWHYTNLHSSGRPSLRLGTPGGSEEPHRTRKRVPGVGTPEGMHVKANWYYSYSFGTAQIMMRA